MINSAVDLSRRIMYSPWQLRLYQKDPDLLVGKPPTSPEPEAKQRACVQLLFLLIFNEQCIYHISFI